jgi:hypothetical protein
MTDGANQGMTGRQALDAVMGGNLPDEQPSDEALMKRVMDAPLPGEGTPIWERKGVDRYSAAADSLAHAFLEVAKTRPGILTKKAYYPMNYQVVSLRGKEMDADVLAWEAAKTTFPGMDEWLGGATGFMVGFAFNLARHLHGLQPAPNPAIVTINIPERKDS